jgi:hypothetical protein
MKRLITAMVLLVSVPLGFIGCGGASAPAGVSAACNSAWSAAVQASGLPSDDLLAVTFRSCTTYAEWKAGWNAYPKAHGSALEPDVWTAGVCSADGGTLGNVSNSPVCLDRAAKGIQPPTF